MRKEPHLPTPIEGEKRRNGSGSGNFLKDFGGLQPYFDGAEGDHWFALAPTESTIFEVWLRFTDEIDMSHRRTFPIKFQFRDAAGGVHSSEVEASMMKTLVADEGFKYTIGVSRRLPQVVS